MSQLHTRRYGPSRVLKRITSTTDELDISWDPGINLVFSGTDLTIFYACAFLDLPLITADPS